MVYNENITTNINQKIIGMMSSKKSMSSECIATNGNHFGGVDLFIGGYTGKTKLL